MSGTMNTRKQVGASRKASLKKLESGQWKKEFDEVLSKYHEETNLEIKDSLKSSLKFKSTAWGINNCPELKQYALDRISEIENPQVKRLTAAEFVQKWKNRNR
ncbi:hypothetical protein Elgi_37160 [Paenibacillus elgii]|uniref:hypothetical protein n=1 Tax=Paenibacillus elgii TaxID=189691 RepID=UPI002D7B6A59|nr:hypothetical protein Elgi_37160 [Paenibacillus elgii]